MKIKSCKILAVRVIPYRFMFSCYAKFRFLYWLKWLEKRLTFPMLICRKVGRTVHVMLFQFIKDIHCVKCATHHMICCVNTHNFN